MGFGGALIWTGLARNLKEAYPEKKVLFIYRKGIKDLLSGKTNKDFVIYENNPDIDLVLPKHKYFFQKGKFNKKDWIIVDMNNHKLQYWIKDTKEKVVYKSGKHAIEWACDYFKIKNPVLKPVIRLTNKEQEKVNELLLSHNLKSKDFIVIEPNSKETFAPNNQWFWDRWQELADLLKNKNNQTLVQLGVPGASVLNGVVSLVGKTSFREAAGVIEQAKLFVGYCGGLMHSATAFDVKAVIVASGFEPLEIANYPQNFNIYKGAQCAPCGLKSPCPHGRECMKKISVQEVYNKILEVLSI